MRQFTTFCIVSIVLCAGLAPATPPSSDLDYTGQFAPAEIYVLVESTGGFGARPCRAALACDGHFRLIGAYSDTTTIRRQLPAQTAIDLAADLLAIDFFGQPTTYRRDRGRITNRPDGNLMLSHQSTVDGKSYAITLHLGSRAHTVTLQMPAHGAPEALHRWIEAFRELVKQQADWIVF